jgi:hypothetical protein
VNVVIATYNPIDLLSKCWVDLMVLALGLWFVNGALTGEFYTSGRGGGKRLIAYMKPGWLRLVSLALAIGTFVFVVHDVVRKIGY